MQGQRGRTWLCHPAECHRGGTLGPGAAAGQVLGGFRHRGGQRGLTRPPVPAEQDGPWGPHVGDRAGAARGVTAWGPPALAGDGGAGDDRGQSPSVERGHSQNGAGGCGGGAGESSPDAGGTPQERARSPQIPARVCDTTKRGGGDTHPPLQPGERPGGPPGPAPTQTGGLSPLSPTLRAGRPPRRPRGLSRPPRTPRGPPRPPWPRQGLSAPAGAAPAGAAPARPGASHLANRRRAGRGGTPVRRRDRKCRPEAPLRDGGGATAS